MLRSASATNGYAITASNGKIGTISDLRNCSPRVAVFLNGCRHFALK